jgi:6-pyruvoyltetrahydropterin/6-carboxytetrahydropterin synthase
MVIRTDPILLQFNHMVHLKGPLVDKGKTIGLTTAVGSTKSVGKGDGKIAMDIWQIDEAEIMQPDDGVCYELAIDIFFNARHHVVIEGYRGPDHAHSYRLQVRCRSRSLTQQDQVVIGYQTLRERIRQVASAYNNRFLNELPPFQHIQPTTENLTAVVFQQLTRTLQDLPVELVSVTVWDSPTEAITITKIGREVSDVRMLGSRR